MRMMIYTFPSKVLKKVEFEQVFFIDSEFAGYRESVITKEIPLNFFCGLLNKGKRLIFTGLIIFVM